jgi:hypothetical protein
MCVFGAKFVRIGFEVGVHVGVGSPCVWGMSVYGQVHVPIDTYEHVV